MNLHYAVSKVWSHNFTQFVFRTLFGKKCVVFQARGSNSTCFCQAQGLKSTCSCRARSSPTKTCAIKTSSLTKTCAIKTLSLTKTCATRTSSPNNNTFQPKSAINTNCVKFCDQTFKSAQCRFIYALISNIFQNNSTSCHTTFKLDGVGPIDNRPSTDLLQHFVQKVKFTFFRKIEPVMQFLCPSRFRIF